MKVISIVTTIIVAIATLMAKLFKGDKKMSLYTLVLQNEDKTQEKEYQLDGVTTLYRKGNVYDSFNVDSDGVATVTRRIGIDPATGESYVLPQPITTTWGSVEIQLYEGINYLKLLDDNNTILSVSYILKNEFTNTYATRVEMTATIEASADNILLEVSEKYPEKDAIISSINLSPEEIKIQSGKIALEGYTTINNGFSVDLQGNMSCQNASVQGDLYMSANKKLASVSQGIMSSITNTSVGSISGYQMLGYNEKWDTSLFRNTAFVDIYIPNNFNPVYAYLYIEQINCNWDTTGGTVAGQAKNITLKKGGSLPTISAAYNSYYENLPAGSFSGTDITNAAYGSNTKTFNIGMTKSNNIANKLTKGDLNVLSMYTNSSASSERDAAALTGLIKATIQVIGYLDPFTAP